MVRDIFSNITILASFLLVIGQLYKNRTLSAKQPLKVQLIMGLVFGFLGIVLMIYNITITSTVIVDLRNIAIICAGIIGGPVSAITSSVLIAIFRILFFGFNQASLAAHIIALVVGAGVAYLSVKGYSRKRQFITMFLFAILVSTAALVYLIHDRSMLIELLMYYWPIHIFGIILAYFTCEYIISANLSLKTMTYYKLTADNLVDVISTLGPGGNIEFVSPSVYKMFGYTQEELLGKSTYSYIHPGDIAAVQKAFQNTENDMTQTFRLKHKNGSYVWIETSVKLMRNENGSVKELVCVTRDISRRKKVEEELKKEKQDAERLASIDYLTGLMNRRAFMTRFNEEFIRAQREKRSISLIFTDIDHFKQINDQHGHDIGDVVLMSFAQCLQSHCRPYDILARQGGEEFIICLPHTDQFQAMLIAERMRSTVEKLSIVISSEHAPIAITASFGIVSPIFGFEESGDYLIKCADKAMYEAKKSGRNRVYVMET